MTFVLRPYQQEAVASAFDFLTTKDGNGILVLPTGTGKSLIIAEICRRAIEIYPRTRIIVATHSKELVANNCDELRAICPELSVGVFSAGLGKKEKNRQVVFAGIQSIWRHAFKFPAIDILLIDEAHSLTKKEEGTWFKFIADLKVANPNLRILGLSASPFRMTQGMIYGKDCLFTHKIYEYGLIRAIEEGYLSPLRNHRTEIKYDVSGVHRRGGEFIDKELQAAVNIDALNRKCVAEIIEEGKDRKAWIAFCSGIDHSLAIRDIIREHGISCETVTGGTPRAERDSILARYKKGEIRCVTNHGVLTTGFNYPAIDLLISMRPTGSPGLWLQICGRAMRKANGKVDAKILDFADNTGRHGPLDKIKVREKMSSGDGDAPSKLCVECMEICPASAHECKNCGYIFPIDNNPKILDRAVGGALLSTDLDIRTLTVRSVHYARHKKIGKADSFKITYLLNEQVSGVTEWVFPESEKRARFEAWWRKRSKQLPPKDVTGCLELKETLVPPTTITVRKNGKFDEVIGHSSAETPKCHEAFDKLFQGEKPLLNIQEIPSVPH